MLLSVRSSRRILTTAHMKAHMQPGFNYGVVIFVRIHPIIQLTGAWNKLNLLFCLLVSFFVLMGKCIFIYCGCLHLPQLNVALIVSSIFFLKTIVSNLISIKLSNVPVGIKFSPWVALNTSDYLKSYPETHYL